MSTIMPGNRAVTTTSRPVCYSRGRPRPFCAARLLRVRRPALARTFDRRNGVGDTARGRPLPPERCRFFEQSGVTCASGGTPPPIFGTMSRAAAFSTGLSPLLWATRALSCVRARVAAVRHACGRQGNRAPPEPSPRALSPAIPYPDNAAENQVRSRLRAGGSRIRTLGPARDGR
jgi:hypothetical protein